MMKKVISILFTSILSMVVFSSFGQLKTPRSSDVVTVEDSRLYVKYNFGLPRFNDTLDANLHLGLDSCGTMIFTRSDGKIWKRLCNPKKWDEVSASASGPETDPVWTSAIPSYRTKIQNDLLYYPLSGNPSGFLTSFSETDPVWTGVSSTYRTKTQNDLLYYPLTGNPSNFLTSFNELDPVWLTDKTSYRTKVQNDVLYYPLSGNPSNFLTSFSEVDPVWTGVAGTYRTKVQNDVLYYPLSGNPSNFLTSFSELDPVWLADKPNYLSSATAASTYSVLGHSHSFSSLTGKPTTVSGYGITDAFTQALADALYSALGHTHSFSSLTAKPTTLAGYGITDAAGISHTHAAADINSGTIATARLGSGTANASTYLAGDQSYKTAFTQAMADALYSALGHTHAFSALTAKPTTLAGYGITDAANIVHSHESDVISAYATMGSVVVGTPIGLSASNLTTSVGLTDGGLMVCAVTLSVDHVLNGVKWYQTAQGSYTGDNENRIGLYTLSAGTFTLVASTTNDANLWTAATSSFALKAFSSTYSATKGLYFVGVLYNQSSQTTGPTVGCAPVAVSTNAQKLDFANSVSMYFSLAGQNTLPTSFTMAGTTTFTNRPLFFVY